MIRARSDWRLVVAASALLASGCGEELGPVVGPTTRVVGIVREARQPVRGGWIEFYPLRGAVGNLRVGPIGPDGRFDVDGVAVGTNGIGFAQLPIRGPYWFRFRSYQSSLRRKIPPGRSTELDIDLLEEAAVPLGATP